MEKDKDNYDKEEAARRFEAALRGARAAGHKPMEKTKRKRKPKKKSKASA